MLSWLRRLRGGAATLRALSLRKTGEKRKKHFQQENWAAVRHGRVLSKHFDVIISFRNRERASSVNGAHAGHTEVK